MTLAYSSAHCLARLFSSTILYCNIVIWSRPCLSLIAPCLKNAFICEDEMPAIAYDLIDLPPKLYGLIGILLVELVFLLWHVLRFHLLVLEAMELEYLAVVFRLYDAIRKLAMEQLGSLRETQVC